MSSSDEETTEENNENQTRFALLIKNYPVIFSKSKTPASRKYKTNAIKEIEHKLEKNYGIKYTAAQILKKINNMKSRIKKKTDVNRTGNKKIILKEWEKIILELIDGKSNPVINQIPGQCNKINKDSLDEYVFNLFVGAISVGCEDDMQVINEPHIPLIIEEFDLISPAPGPCNLLQPLKRVVELPERSQSNKKIKQNIEKFETEETRDLPTNMLQRLVLLKQLKVLELKEKKLHRELDQSSFEQ